ncbi:MAG: hypothetical protein ACREQQ_16130 [Candidatus Binatia bacterium]
MDSRAKAPSRGTRRIPPPDGSREPLKVNVFEKMQTGNTQLMPLFPYLGPGAIVPAGAIFQGAPNADYGQFFHSNSVDEVVVVFGAEGALLQSGQVYVTANTHGVNAFLKDQTNPESYLVVTITQRQRVGERQQEALVIRCRKCSEPLVKLEYDATPAPGDSRTEEGPYGMFPTIPWSARMAEELNESEEKRTCAKCGTVNPRFPLPPWGWAAYREQSRTVNASWRAFRKAARKPDGD